MWYIYSFFVAVALAATSAAASASDDERWGDVYFVDQCHSLAQNEIEFADCLFVISDRMLTDISNRLDDGRAFWRAAFDGQLNRERFKDLIRSDADTLEREIDYRRDAYQVTAEGAVWFHLEYPRLLTYLDKMNTERMVEARRVAEGGQISLQAEQLLEESRNARDRLRATRDTFEEVCDDIFPHSSCTDDMFSSSFERNLKLPSEQVGS